MTTPNPDAIDAGARALFGNDTLWDHAGPGHRDTAVQQARAAYAAMEPLIRRQVAEEIAVAIEETPQARNGTGQRRQMALRMRRCVLDIRSAGGVMDEPFWTDARNDLARILAERITSEGVDPHTAQVAANAAVRAFTGVRADSQIIETTTLDSARQTGIRQHYIAARLLTGTAEDVVRSRDAGAEWEVES